VLAQFLLPEVALVIVVTACFLFEAAQQLRLYEAHFDPIDFAAYVSLVVPCYVAERWLVDCQISGRGISGC
jgi:hypothetical protein